MPLEDSYMEQLKSPVADLKNAGGRLGGSITAALFLKEFVKTDKVGAGCSWGWVLQGGCCVRGEALGHALRQVGAACAQVGGEDWPLPAHPPDCGRPTSTACRCSGATWTLRARCGGRKRVAPPALARSCWQSGPLARASESERAAAGERERAPPLPGSGQSQPISLPPPLSH